MRKTRVAFGAGACFAVLGGLAFVQCRDATEIVVDVRADDCEVRDTAISVGTTLSSLVGLQPSAYTGHDGCEPGTDRIGTLTIYPDGAKDKTVSFKVVTGVRRPASECLVAKDQGCIASSRKLRFVPGTSQHVVVKMSRKCLDAICSSEQTCIEGVCVDVDKIDDQGNVGPDAGQTDASFLDRTAPAIDAGATDANDGGVPDAGVDACAGCKGSCDGGSCLVACGPSASCTGEVCAPTLPCTVQCGHPDDCKDVKCTTTRECAMSCTARDACDGIACRSAACTILCQGQDACHGNGIDLEAGSASLTCQENNACNTSAKCSGGTCNLDCNKGGGGSNCPNPRPCAGNCANWD